MRRSIKAIPSLAISTLLLAVGAPVEAQQYYGPTRPGGTPVDRNVGDFTANAVSQRVVEPGNGQFGINSILLDRYRQNPFAAVGSDPYAGDPNIRHRYLLQMPGVTALMNHTEYIGLDRRGKLVKNKATRDGDEILTYSADTYFVLSPDLLYRLTNPPVPKHEPPEGTVPIKKIDYAPLVDRNGFMQNMRRSGKEPLLTVQEKPEQTKALHQLQQDPNYVHPEIIERRRKLKEEREREAAEKRSRETDQSNAKSTGHDSSTNRDAKTNQ